jgi:hypothetical protein
MYEVKCLVDDKKLAAVGHALDGLVYEMKFIPVRGAQVKNGKVHATSNGSMEDAVLGGLKNGARLTASMAASRARDAGFTPGGAASALHRLVAKKVIKRVGKGQYEVRRG